MNKNGSTTLLVIIISAVCLPVIAFSLNTLVIQSKLNFNRINTIQGELNLETEINRIIYDQNGINSSIISIIKKFPDNFIKPNNLYNIPITSNLLDNVFGEISFENAKDDTAKFKLKLSGKYNEMEINKNIIGSVCNSEIDDCDNGLVYSQGRSQKYIDSIEEILTRIPDSVDMDFLPNAHSLVRISNYNEIKMVASPHGISKLYFNNNQSNHINIAHNRIFLVVKSDGFNKNNVLIDCSNHDLVPIYGIVYIENGDLTFKGKCNFYGIILIKDGEIKSEGEEITTISGKVVLNSFKDPRENVEINYNSTNYLKYAKYLSPLLEPKIIKLSR